jgi:hypothetical protein
MTGGPSSSYSSFDVSSSSDETEADDSHDSLSEDTVLSLFESQASFAVGGIASEGAFSEDPGRPIGFCLW